MPRITDIPTDPDGREQQRPIALEEGPNLSRIASIPMWMRAATMGVVVLFVAAALLSVGPAPPPVTAVVPTAVATAMPTATPTVAPPTYASASNCIEMILAQERAGQWDVASTNARTCLTMQNLSPTDAAILVQKALADGLQVVNASKINPDDYTAQEQAVDRYEDLKRFAANKRVPLPKTFYQVAQDAGNTGRFLLARVAFRDALDHGDVSGANLAHVRFLHDVTYNLSWWLTRDRSNPKYDEGLRFLVAADRLDRQYHLDIGLARVQLQALEPDEAKWPNPASTPFLLNNYNKER